MMGIAEQIFWDYFFSVLSSICKSISNPGMSDQQTWTSGLRLIALAQDLAKLYTPDRFLVLCQV